MENHVCGNSVSCERHRGRFPGVSVSVLLRALPLLRRRAVPLCVCLCCACSVCGVPFAFLCFPIVARARCAHAAHIPPEGPAHAQCAGHPRTTPEHAGGRSCGPNGQKIPGGTNSQKALSRPCEPHGGLPSLRLDAPTPSTPMSAAPAQRAAIPPSEWSPTVATSRRCDSGPLRRAAATEQGLRALRPPQGSSVIAQASYNGL